MFDKQNNLTLRNVGFRLKCVRKQKIQLWDFLQANKQCCSMSSYVSIGNNICVEFKVFIF